MGQILPVIVSFLATSAPLMAAEKHQEQTAPRAKTVAECLVERVNAETGREFSFFLACCKALGLKRDECRAQWAAQVQE